MQADTISAELLLNEARVAAGARLIPAPTQQRAQNPARPLRAPRRRRHRRRRRRNLRQGARPAGVRVARQVPPAAANPRPPNANPNPNNNNNNAMHGNDQRGNNGDINP